MLAMNHPGGSRERFVENENNRYALSDWSAHRALVLYFNRFPGLQRLKRAVVNFMGKCCALRFKNLSGAPSGSRTLMNRYGLIFQLAVVAVLAALWGGAAVAQTARDSSDAEFGPVVRAYLGYLKDEQEVVDDRVSRREISPAYYRRNSSRIRALRQTAIRIARESGNDYLPELEAAARDELKNLFENPPSINSLRVGEVVNNTFRYLGSVRSGEVFYIFARLDPYEQAELMEKEKKARSSESNGAPETQRAAPTASTGASEQSRPRRAASSP